VFASACGVASSTALERNTASRNDRQGNHRVFMVGKGRRGGPVLWRPETVMDLLIDRRLYERRFGTDHRNE
jgi:hypothetical protein